MVVVVVDCLTVVVVVTGFLTVVVVVSIDETSPLHWVVNTPSEFS